MIAVLGYGSLIWDLEILEPHVQGPWAMGGGPALPMEFSRISPKRKMGLVACLDPEHGVACPTHAIASRRDAVEAAAQDLAITHVDTAARLLAAALSRNGAVA